MPISIQKQLHQEGSFPYYRLESIERFLPFAGEEEINGELVPLRMGVDGGVQWFSKWGVPFSWAAADGLSHPLLLLLLGGMKASILLYSIIWKKIVRWLAARTKQGELYGGCQAED